MLFSATGISVTMVTFLVANQQNTISHIFLLTMSLFIYVGSILICFHNGSSVCIILCILCRPLRCVVRACENLSVFIHMVMAERKCSIKSEYPFIKGVNENAECTLSCPDFYHMFRVFGENNILGTLL
jgi:hypothetical protein